MISSSSFEVRIESATGVLFASGSLPVRAWRRPLETIRVDATTSFSIQVNRDQTDAVWRVVLGNSPLGELSSSSTAFSTDRTTWFWNEVGESLIEIQTRMYSGDGTRFDTLFTLPIEIEPRPDVLHHYRVMQEDLAEIHERLADDVLGRSLHRRSTEGGRSRLQPEMLERLNHVAQRLSRALAVIALQPTTGLDRTARWATYRGGDRIDGKSLQSIALDPRTRFVGGQLVQLGRVRLRKTSITEDLPEHRHIAKAIRDLARRARQIREHCLLAAQALREEESRWGRGRGQQPSVYDQRDLPRVKRLEEIAAQAPRVELRLQQLLEMHPFLANAGLPRTPFGPTPVFLGRPAYREVYDTLTEARRTLGLLVDGAALKTAYRGLSSLYEYWCYLRVVAHLQRRFGAPLAESAFRVIDDVYRPELTPGQRFIFEPAAGVQVIATYSPEFKHWKIARDEPGTFGATLTRDPLRPDITIELRRPKELPVLLVLDAKSTEHFHYAKFREMSDYSRQIVEPRSGYQPVRQVLLLHRDQHARTECNLPIYPLAIRKKRPKAFGKRFREATILGAVPVIPKRPGYRPKRLAWAIDLFFDSQELWRSLAGY